MLSIASWSSTVPDFWRNSICVLSFLGGKIIYCIWLLECHIISLSFHDPHFSLSSLSVPAIFTHGRFSICGGGSMWEKCNTIFVEIAKVLYYYRRVQRLCWTLLTYFQRGRRNSNKFLMGRRQGVVEEKKMLHKIPWEMIWSERARKFHPDLHTITFLKTLCCNRKDFHPWLYFVLSWEILC